MAKRSGKSASTDDVDIRFLGDAEFCERLGRAKQITGIKATSDLIRFSITYLSEHFPARGESR